MDSTKLRARIPSPKSMPPVTESGLVALAGATTFSVTLHLMVLFLGVCPTKLTYALLAEVGGVLALVEKLPLGLVRTVLMSVPGGWFCEGLAVSKKILTVLFGFQFFPATVTVDPVLLTVIGSTEQLGLRGG
jgi:hypothetical protein